MPLRYRDALKWLPGFQHPNPFADDNGPINPLWLADGIEPVHLANPLWLPHATDVGLPDDITFLQFTTKFCRQLLGICSSPPVPDFPLEWLAPYLAFMDGLTQKATTLRDRLATFDAALDVAITRSRTHGQPSTEKEFSNNLLTDVSESIKSHGMKSPMLDLLDRLKRATSQPGSKTVLAAYMKVNPANLSQWLHGHQKPSGETTLRLLQWVEQHEAQQKQSAGSVSAPPAPKTQSQRSNEKHSKSGPPKP